MPDSKEKLIDLFLRSLLFIALFVVSVLMIAYIGNVISPIYKIEKNRKILYEKQDSFDSIFFGNSHTRNLYIKNNNIFYLYSSSEDLFETLEKMQKSLKYNKIDKCAIINISPDFYMHNNARSKPANRIKYYNLTKSGLLNNDGRGIYFRGKIASFIRPDKWKEFFGTVYYYLTRNDKYSSSNVSTNGNFIKNSVFYQSKKSRFRAKLDGLGVWQLSSQLNNKKSIMKNYMRNFIELKLSEINLNELNVIFYTTTFLPEYFINRDQAKIQSELNEIFEPITKKFENVEYFNFLGLEEMNNEKYYYDSHMNETGAIEFTKLFKQKLKDNNIDCGLD